MARKPAGFQWTILRERAAVLAAADTLNDETIAAQLGIGHRTLDRWKVHPEFAERVRQHVERTRAALERARVARVARGIADRQNRVDALDERWHAMQRVIAERGADPTMAEVPGGRTGLLVRTYKVLGTGESAERVEEYRVDAGTLRELREHEKQAAQELGQWADEAQNGGAGDAKTLRIVIDTQSEEAV